MNITKTQCLQDTQGDLLPRHLVGKFGK